MAQARLTFHVLGSGCYAPGPNELGRRVRNPAGYALETPSGTLLFDFGFGNLRQLHRAGIPSRRVSHAFLTHRHPDHVGDLASLLFHYHYEAKPERGALAVLGPEGFRAFFRRLRAAYEPWLEPKGYALRVAEIPPGGVVEGAGWRVRAHGVPHPTPALAYRWEGGGRSVVYSGDMGRDRSLAAFARGADLLVLECTLPDRARYRGHLRVADALALGKASEAKRVLLSHLSESSAADARGRLPAGVSLARDLQRVRL